MSQSFHVEWFVTDHAQPDVTVHIDDGRLIEVTRGRAAGAVDYARVALISGLVNCHTHLEFSSLAEPIPTHCRFTDWIRAVIRHRRDHGSDVPRAIRSGIQESLRSGTTLIGDIATVGWTDADYLESPIPVVVFQELLGLSPERVKQQKELAKSHLKLSASESDDNSCSVAWGLSPHAPYSTHWDLVREAVNLAGQSRSPIAMHLAESTAEIEFLKTHSGEFREFLTDLGLWRDDLFEEVIRPIDYLKTLAEAPRALVVHGNYLNNDELGFIASQPQMTLVYCPRTHAAFGHQDHPWLRLNEAGGRLAIGTDSRASNPDLSIFAELQFLAQQHPDVSHVDLLQFGSVNGRRALGIHTDTNAANFTLIGLADPQTGSPDKNLFTMQNVVCGTMINGSWAWLASDLASPSS